MTRFTLYHMPRACSFVTMNAMEEAGIEYELFAVNIFKKEQKTAEYLKLNPEGKVPTLVVDGVPLNENASILLHLNAIAPNASLLPGEAGSIERAKAMSALIWCSSTLHPSVRMVRMPIRFTDGDASGVEAKGHEMVVATLQRSNERLSERDFWFGDTWSIVDVYFQWCVQIAVSGGVSLDSYRRVIAHRDRVEARPSFERASIRQEKLVEQAGIKFPA